MKRKILLLILTIALSTHSRWGETDDTSPLVGALKKYILEKDYPELFKDKPYRTRIENILIVDINNDGKNDLIVHFFPHYRQSPSIVMYQVSSKLEIARIKEGLAPGPLKPVGRDYLDSHTLGEAVDFDIGDKQNDPDARNRMLKASSKFGGVVAYRNFFHADNRIGSGSYIDMTHIDTSKEIKNCESFEFSKVRQIAAGNLRRDKANNYLAAWVEDQIYVYLIKGVSGEGLLDKRLWIVKAPSKFKGFLPGEGLAYKTLSGKTEILDVK